MEKQIEKTLDSREVAEMIEKDHAMLLRDLRRYEKQFTECNIAVSDFFEESTYKDSTGRTLTCYNITKKGCEFRAHKLTGTKGTAFTARYINRFHEMEDIVTAGQAAVQAQGNRGFEELQAAVQKQEKMLESISRKLSGTRVIGTNTWGRNEEDMYRGEIIRMVESLNDREALCKVYTFTKYIPEMAKK